jgi:hypothetical protein
MMPDPGTKVYWQTFGEHRVGTFIGLAPGDHGHGDPYVAVDASNGRVHVRLSALVW